jgi:GTP 3',8-cyclase
MASLQDNFGRQLSYLRLSLTDICNFRCGYCLPDGCHIVDKNFLSLDEIRRLITAFAELGMKKIRLVGGEPTIRKDFIEIAQLISQIPGIKELALTTNAYHLLSKYQDYYNAGIRHINVSIDSLKPEIFHNITGHNCLPKLLQAIEKTQQIGFDSVKINTILLKDINHSEIDDFIEWAKNTDLSIRFLELMETGLNKAYFHRHHVNSDIVRSKLIDNGWNKCPRKATAGPAEEYYHAEYIGRVGIIAPYSKDFCLNCNRLRMSSRGALHLCLFTDISYSLRDLLQHDEQKAELKMKIQKLLHHKKEAHALHNNKTGLTDTIASIGG